MSGVEAWCRLVDSDALVGTILQTPDAKTGKPFRISALEPEGLRIGTSSGGTWRLSASVFDVALKYLGDHECRGENWLPINDRWFREILLAENDGKACASYVLPILEHVGLVEIQHQRPNRVRLT